MLWQDDKQNKKLFEWEEEYIQFDNVVPFDVVAGLREIVINVENVDVAFFGA